MHPVTPLARRGGPRRILPFVAVIAAAAALVTAACNRDRGAGADAELTTPGDTGVLRDPIVIRSNPSTHILDVTLAAVDTFGVGGVGTDTLFVYKLLSANGVDYSDSARAVGLPGPTFLVHPGDSVRLLLVNQLPPNPSTGDNACLSYPADTVHPAVDTFPNCFHGPNSTNIHYHGFHVTPDSVGDDVLLLIPPGQQHQYAFRIPPNQSPGTHWYHPHKHGSVALQVTNGMSGAFIVQDTTTGLDSISTSLHMTEHVLAIQQITTAPGLMGTAPGAVTLVNGQDTPRIVMHPGEVQRWRIVDENINPFAQFNVGFVGANAPQLWDIARDGVAYAPANYDFANPDTVLTMGPGNRLDVFVKAPRAKGTYRFQVRPTRARASLLQTRRGTGGGRGGANGPVRALTGAQQDSVVATTGGLVEVVVVDGPAPDTIVPTTLPALPAFLANLAAPADTTPALIVYTDTLPGKKSITNPTQFFLGNGQQPRMRYSDAVYVPASAAGAAMPMLLGQTQNWRIENRTTQGINHPHHIHINPFQVLSVAYDSATDPDAALFAALNAAAQAGFPIWLDVIPLPLPYKNAQGQTVPGVVNVRQEYKDFTGQFVMHCHILGHEERGMMQLLQVSASAGATAAAPRASPHAHGAAATAPAARR